MPDRDPAPSADPPVSPPTLRHVPGKNFDPARNPGAPPRIVDLPQPPVEARPRSKVLGGLAVSFVVIAAYAGAVLFFRFAAPNRPPYVAEVGSGLAIGIVVFFLHSMLGGSLTEAMQSGEERFRVLLGFIALVAPSFVRWILLGCLGGMLVVAYQDLGELNEINMSSIARLRALGACAMPAILAVCSSMLVERRFARGDFRLKVSYAPGTSTRDRIELREKIERMWVYENELMRESVQRMARHAAIFGFVASAILIACAVILLRYARTQNELRYLVALSVGAACTVSFTLNLGQILFRSASNDSTARMMAWSARTLLVVSVAAVFLGVALLSGPDDGNGGAEKGYLFQGYKGALIVGVAVALLGERALRTVTDRAASVLGVNQAAPMRGSDLTLIDGLNDEDVARLSEERIDSAHALAFMPTPRIFFNTTYSLQRICDWQDQALLIARVGRTNAQLLREQYLVRGAIAARQLAREIVGPSRSALSALRGPAESSSEPISVPAEPHEDEQDRLRALAKALGFTGINQAVLGLRCLVDDEEIERLEVFSRSVPVWKDMGTEHVRDETHPRVD